MAKAVHRARAWWDAYYIGLAKYISQASKDPSTKCGAVIVTPDGRPISWGYNGFPRGIADDHRLDDRATKYDMMCHAESNAMDFATRDLEHCTIFTWPVQPCSRCAARIIQVGITKAIFPHVELNTAISLRHQFRLALELFAEAGITVRSVRLVRGNPDGSEETGYADWQEEAQEEGQSEEGSEETAFQAGPKGQYVLPFSDGSA